MEDKRKEWRKPANQPAFSVLGKNGNLIPQMTSLSNPGPTKSFNLSPHWSNFLISR
jgi:hypothetical protein